MTEQSSSDLYYAFEYGVVLQDDGEGAFAVVDVGKVTDMDSYVHANGAIEPVPPKHTQVDFDALPDGAEVSVVPFARASTDASVELGRVAVQPETQSTRFAIPREGGGGGGGAGSFGGGFKSGGAMGGASGAGGQAASDANSNSGETLVKKGIDWLRKRL